MDKKIEKHFEHDKELLSILNEIENMTTITPKKFYDYKSLVKKRLSTIRIHRLECDEYVKAYLDYCENKNNFYKLTIITSTTYNFIGINKNTTIKEALKGGIKKASERIALYKHIDKYLDRVNSKLDSLIKK